jgi:hypothetical protein
VKKSFEIMEEQHNDVNSILCAGSVPGGLIFYIRKEDYKRVRDVELTDRSGAVVKPEVYRLEAFQRGRTVGDAIRHINDSLIECVSNIVIKEKGAETEFGFARIYAATKPLSKEQLIRLHGKCKELHWTKRSEFQKVCLRIYKNIVEMRELKSRPNPLIFNAFDPPLKIVPLTQLVTLRTQKGTRLKEVDMTMQSYDLADLLTLPLLSKYGVIILGDQTPRDSARRSSRSGLQWNGAKPSTREWASPKRTAALSSATPLTLQGKLSSSPAIVG